MKRRLAGICISVAFLGVMGCLELNSNTTKGTGGSSSSGTSSGEVITGKTIFEWDANAAPQTGNPPTYTMPPQLSIECPTPGRTSQTSANSLKTGYEAHAARPRNAGKGWGLSVESKRMNYITHSDSWQGANWALNGMYPMVEVLNQLDPAGSNKATLFQASASLESRIDLGTDVMQPATVTSWCAGKSGPAPYAYFVNLAEWVWVGIDDTSWKRYELHTVGKTTYTAAGTGAGPGGNPPTLVGDREFFVYGAQIELDAKYPSSYFPTGDSRGTRDADKLYSNVAAELLPDGYWNVVLRYAPNYASTEASAAYQDLLFIDDTNRLFIDLATGKLTLTTAGASLTGPGAGSVTWKRDQELTISIAMTPQGRKLELSGATSGNFNVADMLDKPSPAPLAAFYLFGDALGTQEGVDLRYIGFASWK